MPAYRANTVLGDGITLHHAQLAEAPPVLRATLCAVHAASPPERHAARLDRLFL
jgi:hypothetical protein